MTEGTVFPRAAVGTPLKVATAALLKEVKALHRQAMDFADQALIARAHGHIHQAVTHLEEAYGLEILAANIISDYAVEPTRSVLHRSAATLAVDCARYEEAVNLVRRGLRGTPPAEIAQELTEVLQRVPKSILMALPAEEEPSQAGTLLEDIREEAGLTGDPDTVKKSRVVIEEFFKEVLAGSITMARDIDAMISARITQIDYLVSLQLSEIMHNVSFQRLEGTWRGLKYLIDESAIGSMLKIKVFNVSKWELWKDLQGVKEFDQSALFKKVYEEYGVFGGSPFGALVGDYEFGKHPDDIELLEKVSDVAAAAHAPFVSAPSPDLFNLPSYTSLDAPRDLAKIFNTTEYDKWKSFRQSEGSRYVALCLPRTLGRLPYGKDSRPVEGFNYQEHVDVSDHSKYLWVNAAYSLASRMTDSFSRFGMCVAMRGLEGGGLVQGLPVHNSYTDKGDVVMKGPTEVPITDHREKELADLGFVPLVHCSGTDYAAFFSVQTVQQPKLYNKDSADVTARLSAQLPYIMAVSRFVHYLKAMMRDKIGTFMSRSDVEMFLNRWIMEYVVPDDTVSPAMKARCPLREARIDIVEVPRKPGVYQAVAFLRPHFQLDKLSVSLRLVVELPAPAK